MSFLCGCFGGDCRNEAHDETDGKKGKPLKYDPDFRGPIRGKSRRPKDLLCLLLFLVFIVILAAIGLYSFVRGEPQRILNPTDSKGRLCGVHEGVQNKPYLLFFDLTQCVQVVTISELVSGEVDASTLFTCPTPQVCVSECPSANEFGVRDNPVCVDGVDTTSFTNLSDPSLDTAQAVTALLGFISEEKCAPYYVQSTPVARRCVPTFVDVEQQFEDTFLNFSITDPSVEDALSNTTFLDVFRTVSIDQIIDGSFTQALLVQTRQFLLDIYQDFVVVWPALLIGILIALILSFVYILLLRWIAGPIIVIGITLCLLLITTISAFCYYQFYCFRSTQILDLFFSLNTTALDFVNSTEVQDISTTICEATSPLREFIDAQLPWFEYQEWTWLGIGIAGTLLLLILVILLIFLGNKICISIAIIKEASKAVGGIPTSVFYPVVTWLFLIILFIYWGIVAVFLVTASEPTYVIVTNSTNTNLTELGITEYSTAGEICDPMVFNDTRFVNDSTSESGVSSVSCQFEQFVTSNFLLGIQIYHLFGLFWLGNFILALGECTLAGAFASWYWAYNKPKDVPTFALIQSFGRAILFHSGSLAFGSLLIAIIQILRVLLAYIQKKLKGKTGRIAKALLCLLQCCLWCFEKVLRYINRQAYIEIAIYGYDFCTAACKVVKLLLRNILTTAVKDRIVAFLLFLGKLAITALVGILAYIGFGGYLGLGEQLWGTELNYYLIPVILLVILTYFIASGFMSVYHMAVDTVFICAMEDLERNNGHDKPYFMSKKLMKLLNAKNVNHDHVDGGEPIQMESVETIDS